MMAESKKSVLHVSPEGANQTLSAALRRWMPDKSWNEIRQLMRARRVLLDGNLAQDPGYRLKAGQVIKLLEQSLAPPATEQDVRICYRDAEVVVVEKPAGMTSIRHPEEMNWPARRRQLQPTLTELLPRVLARIEAKQAGQNAGRAVRAVHRLDRETSGIMVFARNIKAESFLGRQFREHTIRRLYWAIVAGRVEEQTIDTNLVRDRGDGRRGTASHDEAGKRAVTHVRPLEHLSGFTVVECRLETGRTHQIRIHLADLGHPVCGDKVYGGRGNAKPSSRTAVAPRLALHAGHLGFIHPTSHRLMEFEAAVPEALQQFLARLRASSPGTTRRGNSDAS
ncbi:MAG TPA: RluA family pseudouridine synthase [Pirellulales bacterium]|jgi:23S rRNA pseudouridine1911/1915/1917 synthase